MDAESIAKQFLAAMPDPSSEVDDLTDAEKIALCCAAGIELEFSTENEDGKYMLRATTKRRVGIVKIGNEFRVIQEADTKEGDCIHISLSKLAAT